MKQRISIEQLNELSEKGKEKLKSWAAPNEDYTEKDQDFLCVHQCGNDNCQSKNTTGWSMDREMNNYDWWRDAYPLLSIGQMIEFLDEYTNGYDLNIRIHSAGTGWQRPGQRLVDIDGLPVNEIEDEEELCDALFEAVKEVLEAE